MTDIERYRGEIKYGRILPAKCCWNCACCSADGLCTRLCRTAEINMWTAWSGDCRVSECGICSKWISEGRAAAYYGSSSREEAVVRLAVAGEEPVEELDAALEEKRASDKMIMYADAILADERLRRSGKLSPFPMEALVEKRPRLEEHTEHVVMFRRSGAFWPVWEWLRQNAPAYEAARSRKRILPDAMMRFDFKV